MNDFTQALVLALVQGLTEFLPVSSSAHLILPAQLLGWPDQGLAFDVAVHVGSLVAVLWYFRLELLGMLRGSLAAVGSGTMNADARMVLWLALATVPAGLAGVILGDWIEAELRSIVVIATATLVFGLLLGWADRRSAAREELTLGRALIIGCAQVLALIPGTSRSGITMTAALWLGLSRQLAARFSFLLSIPIIGAAGALKVVELAGSTLEVDWGLLGLACAVAALTAYLCIGWFLALVDKLGMMPFVIYRCVLALVLFSVWW